MCPFAAALPMHVRVRKLAEKKRRGTRGRAREVAKTVSTRERLGTS